MARLDLFEDAYPFPVAPPDPGNQDIDESALRAHIDDVIVDGGVPRPPLQPLDEADHASLRALLANLGVSESPVKKVGLAV